MGQLLPAAVTTIEITCVTMAIALAWGLILAIARLSRRRAIRWTANAYVELFRGTPLLLQIFYVYFVLPNFGLRLDPLVAGVTAISLNYGAYLSEVYRSGFESIPRGQLEAAAALGMSRQSSMRDVVLPQMIRVAIPPLGNYFIGLFKDTALLSTISIVELTFASRLLSAATFQYVPIYTAAFILYFLISFPASVGIRALEAHLRVAR
jgi:His/Glu/Gln/Arg/opine family amino acid ABC transporter permease subunit